MSKIDLSKAKIGDKFFTQNRLIAVLKEKNVTNELGQFVIEVGGSEFYYDQYGGGFVPMGYNIIGRYFDNHVSQQEFIKSEAESERRQKVVSLAEKLLTNGEMLKAYKGVFEAEEHARVKAPTSYSVFVIRQADEFVKSKEQYLKEGKL